MNYNNSVDQNPPNQASVGPNYTAPMDGAPGNTIVHRKGIVTRLDLTGNLTASRTLQFATPNTVAGTDIWLPGDTVFVQVPAHTGAGFTLTVLDIAGNTIAVWPELSANGGMFVYGASTAAGMAGPEPPVDFGAILPGNSPNTSGPGAAWVQGGNAFGAPGVLGTTDANSLSIEAHGDVFAFADTSGNSTFGAANASTSIQSGSAGTSIDSDGIVSIAPTDATILALGRPGLETQQIGITFKGVVVVGNFPTGGSIGTAATTVDLQDWVIVAQTTAGQALTMANPTVNSQAGRRVTVQNVGTVPFTMYGVTIAAPAANAQSLADFAWDVSGARWAPFAT